MISLVVPLSLEIALKRSANYTCKYTTSALYPDAFQGNVTENRLRLRDRAAASSGWKSVIFPQIGAPFIRQSSGPVHFGRKRRDRVAAPRAHECLNGVDLG
jgi:hypothetical protein